jgi:hypothetical protein
MIARAHWKYTSCTVMTVTLRGFAPSTAKLSNMAASAVKCAWPLIRSALPLPGMRNISATRGSRMILRRLSMRLLPRRSGISSVVSSAIRTSPCASPRGEQSIPSGPTVARAQNGAASMMRA